MKPFLNRLIAKKIEVEEKTRGGLILSGAVAREYNQNIHKAEVLSSNVEGIAVGDEVFYSSFTGSPYKNIIILEEKNVLAIEDGVVYE